MEESTLIGSRPDPTSTDSKEKNRYGSKYMKFNFSKLSLAIGCAIFAAAASASDVQIYGIVDEGLSFVRTDADNGQGATNTFGLNSGITKGSRVGIKGAESLPNGWKVGFILENGFEADSGQFAVATSTRLFGREASLYVDHPEYGQLAFGRLQHLTAGYGTWGVAAGILNPYAIGWSSHIAGYKNVFGFNSGRLDNVIAYKSPTVNGFTLYAQYSGNTDQYNGPDGAVENKGSADKYGSLGLKYARGALTTIGTIEWSAWSNNRTDTANSDDGIAVTIGGNYKFDFGTFYLAGQYFDNQWKLPSPSEIVPLQFTNKTNTVKDRMVKGYGLMAGLKLPVAKGDLLCAFGLRDAELVQHSEINAFRISGTVGYRYPLSKRTAIYSAASYTRDNMDKQSDSSSSGTVKVEPNATQVVLGLVHAF